MAASLGTAKASILIDVADAIKSIQSLKSELTGLSGVRMDAPETGGVTSAMDTIKQSVASAKEEVSGGWTKTVLDNQKHIKAWGKGLVTAGGIITGAFAVPMTIASKAAIGQVSSVQQATVALKAYEPNAEKVKNTLNDLVKYARSDLGVLFQRQDLFASAQALKLYGDNTDDLSNHVQILSRSVGLGLSNWDDLNRVVGRVGSTGRLTGNDFDYLKAAGFQLDDSLRNTNITWTELFSALDKGMPTEALAGQADTIRGKFIRMQSALRDLGARFLGVNEDMSGFVQGSLGAAMMRGLEQARALFIALRPAAETFGRALGIVATAASGLVDMILKLPSPVLSGIAVITALSGVALTAAGSFLLLLPRIASTVDAINKLGGVGNILSKVSGPLGKMTKDAGGLGPALLNLGKAHPVLLGLSVAVAAFGLAYKTNFLGLRDKIDGAVSGIKSTISDMKAAFGDAGGEAKIAADQVADFAEATKVVDGVTVYTAFKTNADGTRKEIGDIVKSVANADGKTAQVLIDADDGQYWATIDLATGEISDAIIPVTADTRSFDERVNEAFDVLRDRARGAGLGWAIPLINGAETFIVKIHDVIGVVKSFVDSFKAVYAQFAQIENGAAALFDTIAAMLRGVDFGIWQDAIDGVIATFTSLAAVARDIGAIFGDLGAAVASLFRGDIAGALESLKSAGSRVSGLFQNLGNVAEGVGATIRGAMDTVASILDVAAAKVPAFSRSLSSLSKVVKSAGKVWQDLYNIAAALFRMDGGALKDALRDLGKDAVENLRSGFEFVLNLVGDLGDLLQRGVGAAFDWISRKAGVFQETVSKVGVILSSIIGMVSNLASAFGSLLSGDVSGFFSSLADAVLDAITAIAGAATLIPQLLVDLGQAILAGVRKIDWSGVGSAIISGIVKAISAAASAVSGIWDWIKDTASSIDFSSIGSTIRTGIAAIFRGMGAAIGNIWGWIKDTASSINWGAIWSAVVAGAGSAVADLPGQIAAVAGNIWSWIKDSIGNISWADIKSALTTALEAGISGISAALDWILDTGIPTLSGWIKDVAGDIWGGIKTLAGWASDSVKGAVSLALDILESLGSVPEWLSSAKDWITHHMSWLGAFLDGTAEAFTIAFNFVANFLGQVGQALPEAWSSLKSLIGSAFGWILDLLGIGDDGQGGESVTKNASLLWSFVSNFLGTIGQTLSDAWSSFKNLIGSAFGWITNLLGIGDDGKIGDASHVENGSILWSLVANFLGTIGARLSEAWSSFTGLLGSGFSWLVDLFGIGEDGTVGGAVAHNAAALWSFVANFVGTIGSTLGAAWGSFKSLLGGTFGWVADLFGATDTGEIAGTVSKNAAAMWSFVANMIGTLGQTLGAAWSSFTSLLGDAGSFVKGLFSIGDDGVPGLTTVTHSMAAAWDIAADITGKATNSLPKAWTSAKAVVTDTVSWLGDVLETTKDIAGTVASKIDLTGTAEKAAGFWDSAKSMVSSAASWAGDLISDGWSGATKAVKSTVDFTIDIAGNIGEVIGGFGSWLFGGGGGDEGGGEAVDLQTRLDQIAQDISTGLESIATAISSFDAASAVDDLNTKIVGAFGAMSGDSIGNAAKDWMTRALGLVGGKIGSGDVMSVPRGVDTAVVAAFGGMSGASVGNAMKVWLLQGAAQAAADLSAMGTALATAANTALTTALAAFSGESLATSIQTWFIKAAVTVAGNLSAFGSALATGADTALGTALAGFSGASLSSSILGWFLKAGVTVSGQLSGAATLMASGLDTALGTALGGYSGASLSAAIVGWVNRAQAAASGAVNMSVLANGIGTSLQTTVTPALQTTTTAFTTFANNVRATVQRLGSDVSAAMQRLSGDIQTISRTASNNATATFRTMQASVSASVRSLQASVSGSFRTMQGDATSAFRTLQSSVVGSANAMASGVRSAANQAASGMRGGMNEASAAARNAAGSWAGIVRGAGGGMYSAGYAVGAQASQGVAAGLYSALGSITAAANSIIAEVDRAMRAKAQIHSPSKLTAYIGEMLGLGIPEGSESVLNEVRAGARALADAAMPSIAPVSYPGMIGSPADAGYLASGLAGAGSVTNITILTIPPDEWIQVAEQAERGGIFADARSRNDAISQYMGGR